MSKIFILTLGGGWKKSEDIFGRGSFVVGFGVSSCLRNMGRFEDYEVNGPSI